jgi:WhiB family redox-sensing transcriptional regulator
VTDLADDYASPDLPILGERPAWQRRAACRGKGTDLWFATASEALDAARSVCEACPLRHACLDYALSDPGLVGIWAVTDERERRRMRRASA